MAAEIAERPARPARNWPNLVSGTACAEDDAPDPEDFFIWELDGKNLGSTRAEDRRYKKVVADRAIACCARCPLTLRLDCLRYALFYDEVGIWGGYTKDERDRMRAS